jgi:MoaA/NifB/PqqE/SkfB family radical SAM enzyme
MNKLMIKLKYGLNWNKPIYMLKLARNLILTTIFDKNSVRGIDMSIIHSCNLRCKHCCLIRDENRKVMQLEDYDRVMKEARKMGCINFAFQGGEIFLHPQWEEIIKLAKPKQHSIVITSNGLVLKQYLPTLKKIGVNGITISIDSGIPEEHDEFRGVKGSFDKALESVDEAIKMGFHVVINTTLTPKSLDSEGFKKIIEIAEQRNIIVNTIFGAPTGKWLGNKEILFTEKDLEKYYSLVKEHPLLVRDLDSNYLKRGCPSASQSLYISPVGDVFYCPYIAISGGNLFNESLTTIRNRGMKYFHSQEKCLITENKAFIDRYIEKTKDKDLPLNESAWEDFSDVV